MFISTEVTRHRAAGLALGTTVVLTLLKFGVGFLSGSVGVLSEAIHSLLDLISASITYFTVREAVKPADKEHPFGHGKIETLSSLFESLLLVAAALLIVHEGINHLSDPHPIQHEGMAIAVILISLVVSYFTYRHNLKAAATTESTALHVNALHFLSDVIASGGVLVGLVLLKLTGWLLIDPIMAFGVAGYIIYISIQQVRHALLELSDIQLPDAEVKQIAGILESFHTQSVSYHDLRTRKGGNVRHIDFHLDVCGDMTVSESHAVCDDIEAKILSVFPTASVNIHVEPCPKGDCCPKCTDEKNPQLV